ncbi:hypothetical protein HMPREF0682_2984 [Propionibacterium acidifaciens F0233]|uniref:Uncharacterized protein n=1 Tax=Propionibacterium acidifaciens F0233 TaxID=553198 RepID=U2QVU2_9ACTN|nr:hypothetical protein HMPREF0682_2984 [Propionibacterium acidifaciens F0233]
MQLLPSFGLSQVQFEVMEEPRHVPESFDPDVVDRTTHLT